MTYEEKYPANRMIVCMGAVLWTAIAVLRTLDGDAPVWLLLSWLVAVLWWVNVAGQFRAVFRMDAQGVQHLPGLGKACCLGWAGVRCVTHELSGFWQTDMLIFHPWEGKPLRVYCKPQAVSAVEQFSGMTVEEE